MLDSRKGNEELAQKFASYVGTEAPVKTFGPLEVFHVGSQLFSLFDGRVHYFVELAHVGSPLGRAIYQEEVWRNAQQFVPNQPGRFVQSMMLDYLLPLQGLLCCDRSQSTGGNSLWLTVVAEARARGLPVYIWNSRTDELTELTNADQIDVEWVWGVDPSYKDFRILIRNGN